MALATLPGAALAGSANSSYMISPRGGTLSSPTQTFTWSAGVGVTVNQLYVGSRLGASDIYNSGPTTSHSATATNMPHDGSTVYVTLWSFLNDKWESNSYTYAAAQPSISPTPNSQLTSTSPTFTWDARSGADAYSLYVGSARGANDYFNSGVITDLSVDTSGLPDNGSSVYVRLWYHRYGVWSYTDYWYRATSQIVGP